MAKKDNSQKSPAKKPQDERQKRKLTAWRLHEWQLEAEEQGIEYKGKTKKAIIESFESLNKTPNKSDGRGGAREGAGRPAGSISEAKRIQNKLREEVIHWGEHEVDIKEIRDGQVTKVKKTVWLAMMDKLVAISLKGDGNVHAIKEVLDRILGKATQPVEHSGEIKSEEQYIPTDPATQKAYEVFKKERRKLIAQGYYGDEYEDE